MTIYVWDTSALRNLGMLFPPEVGDSAFIFIRRNYISQGKFYSHELVKEELKAQYEKNRNNESVFADGIRRAYAWIKIMGDRKLLRKKGEYEILKLVSKITNLDIELHKKKVQSGLCEAEKKIKDFINDVISKAKIVDEKEKEPADFYVIATALVLERERGEKVYVVADDEGIANFVNNINAVQQFLQIGSTGIEVIGYKDFLVKEGLELCLQRTGSNPK